MQHSRSSRKGCFHKDTHGECLVSLVRSKPGPSLVDMLMFVYVKKERGASCSINLHMSALNQAKQILYCKTSQSLENADLHAESWKRE